MITRDEPYLAVAALAALLIFNSTSPGAVPSQPEAAGPDTVRLGLDAAVERATRLNEDVLIARAEEARAAGQATEIRAQSLPDISADFSYTRNLQRPVIFFDSPEGVEQISIGNDNDYAFSLLVSQPLLDLSLGPARAAARLSRTASSAAVEAARTRTALEARTAYFTVLLDRQLLGVQERALVQAEDRLQELRALFRAGVASEFDTLTARVEVDNLRPGLLEARNRLELDRNELKRTLEVPLETDLVLTDSLRPPEDTSVDLDAAVRRAMEERADLRAARARIDLQAERILAEERDALPALRLEAGLVRRASSDRLLPGDQDFTQSATAALSLNLPLFDGRARAGRIQQARASRDLEAFRLRRLQEDVRLEVQQAILSLRSAREQIAASESNVVRAERALEIARVRFRNGLSTQLEVSAAELDLTEARSNYAQALFNYNLARAQLRAAVGSP